jgi:hypothetical protein
MGVAYLEFDIPKPEELFTYPSEIESHGPGMFREVQRQHDKGALVRLTAWRVE